MKEEIINLKNQAIARITDAKSIEELEQIRVDLLGRNGKLSNLIKEIRNVEGDERKQVGFLINETKNIIIPRSHFSAFQLFSLVIVIEND